MNNLMLSIDNMEPTLLLIAVIGICMILLLCSGLIIFTLQTRKQVNTINMRLEKIMMALKIIENGEKEKESKSGKNKRGLQLNDNDIQKLKKIGVGMD
jgi:hypothetical protein